MMVDESELCNQVNNGRVSPNESVKLVEYWNSRLHNRDFDVQSTQRIKSPFPSPPVTKHSKVRRRYNK